MAATADDLPNPLDARAGILIRTRRREIGMSQQDLAEACGITFQQIQKYEAGSNRISFSRLVQIAQALKVPGAWFFEGLEDGQLDPEGSRQATEFFRSPEGQTIAHAATKLSPKVRRALADFARNLADVPQAA